MESGPLWQGPRSAYGSLFGGPRFPPQSKHAVSIYINSSFFFSFFRCCGGAYLVARLSTAAGMPLRRCFNHNRRGNCGQIHEFFNIWELIKLRPFEMNIVRATHCSRHHKGDIIWRLNCGLIAFSSPPWWYSATHRWLGSPPFSFILP